MKVKIDIPSAEQMIRRLGLHEQGEAQKFHTANINRRIGKYMPHLSGALETKLKFIWSNTKIEILGPYAKYQYYEKVMVGKAPKVTTDKPLEYTKDFNPQAGPFWDRALVAAEGDVLVAELQEFINRRKR